MDWGSALVERYLRKRLRVQQIAYSLLAFFGYHFLGLLKERLRSRDADPVTRHIYAAHGVLHASTARSERRRRLMKDGVDYILQC